MFFFSRQKTDAYKCDRDLNCAGSFIDIANLKITTFPLNILSIVCLDCGWFLSNVDIKALYMNYYVCTNAIVDFNITLFVFFSYVYITLVRF